MNISGTRETYFIGHSRETYPDSTGSNFEEQYKTGVTDVSGCIGLLSLIMINLHICLHSKCTSHTQLGGIPVETLYNVMRHSSLLPLVDNPETIRSWIGWLCPSITLGFPLLIHTHIGRTWPIHSRSALWLVHFYSFLAADWPKFCRKSTRRGFNAGYFRCMLFDSRWR